MLQPFSRPPPDKKRYEKRKRKPHTYFYWFCFHVIPEKGLRDSGKGSTGFGNKKRRLHIVYSSFHSGGDNGAEDVGTWNREPIHFTYELSTTNSPRATNFLPAIAANWYMSLLRRTRSCGRRTHESRRSLKKQRPQHAQDTTPKNIQSWPHETGRKTPD